MSDELNAGPAPEQDREDFEQEKARIIAESRKYRQRAQKAEQEVRELTERVLSDADLELFERLKGEAESRVSSERSAQRETEELIDRLKADRAAEIEARDSRTRELTGLLSEVICSDRLKTALAARGVRKVDQAATLLAPRVRVTLHGGRAEAEVLDQTGRPMQAHAGGPVSIDSLVEAWLADNAHFLPPSGDSGSGARRGVGGETVTLADLDADPARKAEFIRRHGTRKYLRLAEAAREKHTTQNPRV